MVPFIGVILLICLCFNKFLFVFGIVFLELFNFIIKLIIGYPFNSKNHLDQEIPKITKDQITYQLKYKNNVPVLKLSTDKDKYGYVIGYYQGYLLAPQISEILKQTKKGGDKELEPISMYYLQ